MTLAGGARVGHYEVISALGAGGMGEVYRARDTRLNRDVALKIIPQVFAAHAERHARFVREAQTLAALNHPHIAQVFGIEEHDTVRALAMELVEGEDLRRLISRGKPPYRQALLMASQIAAALEAAHERGIIHRDLKPANVMVDREGRVKVLDFGLAKSIDPPIAADTSNTPTLTSPAPLTSAGMIVGTASYMSPEQATGRAADKRSDIWSFGCVLYELLTGRRAFEQEDIHSALAAVLAKDPDWSLLEGCSPAIRRLVRRCLEKERNRRLADAGDARLEIEDELNGPSTATAGSDAPSVRHNASVSAWLVAAIATVAALTILLVWAPWRSVAPTTTITRLNAELGAPVSLVTAQGVGAIVSPDGSLLVFVGQPRSPGGLPQLYLRRLDQFSAQPLPGTSGAMSPFFSHDGQWVAFFAGAKLKKVALAGGGAIELADAPNGRGGSWGDDDHIVFMPDFYSGLWRTPAAGGKAIQLTKPANSSGTHRWPQVLPGSTAVIYTSHSALTGYEEADVMLQPLPSGESRVLQKRGYYGRYLKSGHFVYMHEGTLFATNFDLQQLNRSATAVPVLEGVANGAFWTGAAQFASADTGLFVYVPETNTATPVMLQSASGSLTAIKSTASTWSDPAFSRDGKQLAFTIYDGRGSGIWTYDWARDALARLTQPAHAAFKPVWTPDGSRIAFTAARGEMGVFNTAWQRADGAGSVQRLSQGPNGQSASSFHPTGKFLALTELDAQSSFDVMILPIEGDEASGWRPGTPMPFLKTAAVEIEPMFSPDGRWIAYASNESGRFEVYVRPFPGPGGVWQISKDGGTFPTWSPSKKELLFGALDQRLMVVSYESDQRTFRPSAARPWGPLRYQLLGPVVTRHFNLHPDGTRVAMAVAPDETAAGDKIVFLFGFFDALRRSIATSAN